MAVLHTDLGKYLPLVARGKVREIYDLQDGTLLFVATDRISGILRATFSSSTLKPRLHSPSLRCYHAQWHRPQRIHINEPQRVLV